MKLGLFFYFLEFKFMGFFVGILYVIGIFYFSFSFFIVKFYEGGCYYYFFILLCGEEILSVWDIVIF